MSLDKIFDYFHNYDKQTYQVVACMGNEPSEKDVKRFENKYRINLPADFREFTMSPLGGLIFLAGDLGLPLREAVLTILSVGMG